MSSTLRSAPVPVTDQEIQEAVAAELAWTPGVDAAAVGVAVHDGVVTLTGEPGSRAEAVTITRAVQRVRGVAAVADELRVRQGKWARATDAEVAATVAAALQRTSAVAAGAVQATVHDGIVTLTGEVDWNEQREAVTRLVEHLAGVRAVHTSIGLTPRGPDAGTEDRIRYALERNAMLDASHVTVLVDGTEAVLTGSVRSAAERRAAVFTAWSSPHVTVVHDRLRVVP